MKQFVVIGMGRFGSNLAKSLYRLGNQVLAIDYQKRNIEYIKDQVTEAIVADAKDLKLLTQVIDKDVDSVIIATGNDIEMSVLTTLHLRNIGVKHLVAKAKSEDHGEILKALGVDEVIFPEKDIAKRLAEKLDMTNMIFNIPIAHDYSIIEVITPANFVGKSLIELDLRNKYGINIIGIRPLISDELKVVPNGQTIIPPDSAMILICKTDEISKLRLQ
ncbi:potassium channel family protein [Pontibacter pamirensis]|uniref:potassium channel family protein n=1 Tax=Pontibacter pamirensis TaxID=2562824 RepID=UPI00138A22CE|nr:TrkA family potassium uptake protein [Pontibacter pamirensis]